LICATATGVGERGFTIAQAQSAGIFTDSGSLQDRVELLKLTANAAAHLIAELEHARVADRIAGVVSVFAPGDHAGAVEDAEVL